MKMVLKINNNRHIVLRAFQYITLLVTPVFFSSCEKLLEVKPPVDQLVTSSIFADSTTAVAAVNGMYSQLYNGAGSGVSIYSYRISLMPAESADEIAPVQNTFNDFYNNSLTPANGDVSTLWADSYSNIYIANSIIDGAQASSLSVSLKKQLTAEALFVRAFCNFYLVNYFGNIPLLTTSNTKENNEAGASTTEQVYTQIITDLTNARDALPKDYSISGGDRTRVNSYVASALLARVYLYKGMWAEAEAEATTVISQTSLYGMATDPNDVFLANSQEAILQFYTNVYGYTYFSQTLVPVGTDAIPSYAINDKLYNAFETGDNRKTKWISSVTVMGSSYRYPYKYKSRTNNNAEFETAIRLAELYLIRAEARAQQNELPSAISDLEVIRSRAGLGATSATDQASLLLAIEHERQVELFCEWGHRWLDLKRTNRSTAVIGAEKPTGWQTTDVLYPIPQTAINTNPKLKQNLGYF